MVKRSKLVGWFLVGASLFAFTACFTSYRVLSPAELRQHGTRTFGADRAATFVAAHQALEMAGYRIVVEDATTGVLKTAPKVIYQAATGTATAVGNTATATSEGQEDALAWSLSVSEDPNGSVVHAQPHAFRNGLEISDQQNAWADTVILPHFDTLFRAIQSNLGG